MASGGPSVSTNNNNNGDVGSFECNICFELAQDPIVTICGHLFCWPCLYKWLHVHSRSKDCPVCKALVDEDKLVPLYGRGKSSSDPRSKSLPEDYIPRRPTGQRPETAPPPEPNYFAHHHQQQHQHHHHNHNHNHHSFGFAPMASARFGNFTFSAAFGGLIPSLLNFQFNDPAFFGAVGGLAQGLSNSFHGANVNRHHHHHHHQQHQQQHHHQHPHRHHAGQRQQDYFLKRLLVIVLVFVFLTLVWQ